MGVQCKENFNICVLMTEELARAAMDEWERWIEGGSAGYKFLILEGMCDTDDRAERKAVILMESIIAMDLARRWG